jgi:hypothetical protein
LFLLFVSLFFLLVLLFISILFLIYLFSFFLLVFIVLIFKINAYVAEKYLYSLQSILPFANTDVSRYILVLDTFVYAKSNIDQEGMYLYI